MADKLAAKVMGMEPAMYGAVLDQIIAQSAAATGQAATDMQKKLMAGITAAAKELDMDAPDLATSMSKIKEMARGWQGDALFAILFGKGTLCLPSC